MSSLSLPPGRAKTSEDETNNKIKINIPICRLGGAAKSEDVGSEGGRGAAEQDGQPGEDDHRGGEAERQRQWVQRDWRRKGGEEIHQVGFF